MKIDRTKLKKSGSEVPAECKELIDRIKNCDKNELFHELRQVKTWTYGKCELYHWADVLDLFDEILEKSCKKEYDGQWVLPCDIPGNEKLKELLLQVLQFTALLIEHSFTRHLYNSVEHLTTLLASSDMTVVLGVLNLLYVFSKRSNFITRLTPDKKQGLVVRLTHLSESWGGKTNGFGLAECCQDLPMSSYPSSATTLHFEYYAEVKDESASKKHSAIVLSTIHIEDIDKLKELPGSLMESLLKTHYIPADKKMLLFTHIRLAQAFSKYEKRLQCVQARLQAISVLVYASALQENVNTLLYNDFIEELVDVLEVKDERLMEIKATALRTLTSIIHLERNTKLNSIVNATGAASYHGFLPSLVRSCIQHMTDDKLDPFPQPFATALFSFLYHLASYESGGEALVSCGMMESLLRVINWYGDGQEHITFVTRAVRVVDLITNLDMQAFQSHGGLNAFINRLEHEVNICRKEHPFVIQPARSESVMSMDGPMSSPSSQTEVLSSPASCSRDTEQSSNSNTVATPAQTDLQNTADQTEQTSDPGGGHTSQTAMDNDPGSSVDKPAVFSSSPVPSSADVPNVKVEGKGPQCFPQRGALLKSMLNFLKKTIPDPAFSDSIRHLMEGSLPQSLKHIISNAEYYGPSLFLLATDVVTVYVFQEPSLLSSLQDNGLTDVVLQALLVKEVPATREVLASLPNVFSALCLNNRGLEAFVASRPFDRLFKVLLSPDYLPAMRRRRSSDPPGDTASSLGSAMDELMRHQPSLRTDATKAIIKLLEDVCAMGNDPQYICQKPQTKPDPPSGVTSRRPITLDAASSDDDDEDDEVASTHSGTVGKHAETQAGQESTQASIASAQERTAVPLMDYVLNVMKFVEAILSNNTTDDHCREFVEQKGLTPLMDMLGLPNLPVDFPQSPSCQAVAAVCKSILTLSNEPQVLKQGLLHLNDVLWELKPLHTFLEPPGGSVLLHELANAQSIPDPMLSVQATPLLHFLSAAHAYVTMFTHVCKVGQADIRSISISHWGSELGLKVLRGLSKLYTSLVWESTVLLAFCSEDVWPPDCQFGKADLEKLTKDVKEKDIEESSSSCDAEADLQRSTGDMGSNGVSAAMETLTTSESAASPMEIEESLATTPMPSTTDSNSSQKKSKLSSAFQAQIKQIKPLLSVTSRLGRALAELFGLLVKLSVGSPVRQRRFQLISPVPAAPSPAAKAVASTLGDLLAQGFSWTPPKYTPVPKLRLTFYICSVGFTAPMLFDDKRYPYHLMLQKFVSCGGQENMFRAFEWALSCDGKVSLDDGLENPELPDGTGEFLDSWLMLVEKMVNVKNVLETTHTLTTKPNSSGTIPFDPLKYLISTHKMAFNAIMHLWGKKPLKVYGGHMSESILAILCHIMKGESVIREKLEKEQKEKAKESSDSSSNTNMSAPSASATSEQPQVNSDHLQQLMDMGFTREHCVEALLSTNSLEQATEYILSHPPSVITAVQPPPDMELELSEDDEIMRAIAMSLGDNFVVSTDQKAKDDKNEGEGESRLQNDTEPLPKDVLDKFTETMMPGCMQWLDALPGTVYRICDLIIVVANRNGDVWREEVLTEIIAEIAELSLHLIEAASPLTVTDKRTLSEWASQLSTMEQASKLAVRLHLLSLLFEELKMSCAEIIENSGILELLVRLLDAGQQCLTAAKHASTPKWIAPVLLLLDQYERVSISSQRRADLKKLVGKVHIWKWFDDRTGKWSTYASSNNKSIDDAYWKGETSVRFIAGRRRYFVHFNTMVQINDETGNRRPIMLSLPAKEEAKDPVEEPMKTNDKGAEVLGLESLLETDEAKTAKETGKDHSMDTEDEKSGDTEDKRVLRGLMPDHTAAIIRSAIGLISLPVDPDALHAVLRVTLHLTREHETAVMFAESGGCKLLLNLTQASFFQGAVSLVTLILRHVLEDEASLRYTLEKVIRSAAAGTGSTMSGVARGSLGSKELNYVLRVLGPAACRCPRLFAEVAKNTLRIVLPPPAKRDEDEARLTHPNSPQLVSCVPSKQTSIPEVSGVMKDVVSQLLNVLASKYNYKENEVGPITSGELRMDNQSLPEAIQEVVNTVMREINEQHLTRTDSAPDFQRQEQGENQTATDDIPQNTTAPTAESPIESQSEKKTDVKEKEVKDTKDKDDDTKKKWLLMSKSAIMRLLAEMIRSYAGCASLITHHHFQAGISELVTEDCSVLAFIMDHLLPQCQTAGDKDCPALSRVLIASIAASNHSPEAQTVLVTEIKNALQRALAMPESTEKHASIQALMSIISTVIESCPVSGQIQNQVFRGQQQAGSMNNIVKILLKKGLVPDLARITYSLDLSSPHMPTTVNAALKPLETLSRIVNQPQTVNTKPGGKKPVANLTVSGTRVVSIGTGQHTESSSAENTGAENRVNEENTGPSGTQSTEAMGQSDAPGDLTIEDVSDTVIQQEGLEETQATSVLEPEVDAGTRQADSLDDVIHELLGGEETRDPEAEVIGEIIMEQVEEHHDDADADADADVVIDVEVETEESMDLHDSRMMTQDISDDTTDDEDHGNENDPDDESASEGDDEDHEDDDTDEDDEDNDDDEDDGGDEDEDDEGSDSEAEGDEQEFVDMAEFFNRLDEEENVFVHLEEMLLPGQIRTYQLPIAVHDNGNDVAGPAVPPPPSNISASHPLLVRQAEPHAVTGSMAARIHRAGRPQRGTYRYNPNTQTLHVHYTATGARQHNPPAILQRLLGSGIGTDILQLSNSSHSRNPGRISLIAGDEVNFFGGREDDEFDELFQDHLFDNDGTSTGILSSIPQALQRWTEEAKVLDGDSVHDCVTVLKPEIISELEKHRDKALAERRELRRKAAEEEQKKEKQNKEKSTEGGEKLPDLPVFEGRNVIDYDVWRASLSSPSSESHPGTSVSSASTATAVTVTATTSAVTATVSSTAAETGTDNVTTSLEMVQSPAASSNETRSESVSLAVGQTATPMTQTGESMEQSSSRLLCAPQAQRRQQASQCSASGLSMLLASPLDTPVMSSSAMLRAIETETDAETGNEAVIGQSQTAVSETPMDVALSENAASDNYGELARLNAVFDMLSRQGPGQITPLDCEELPNQSQDLTSQSQPSNPLPPPTEPAETNTTTGPGRITPEQTSDITSSDAVTINSSSGNSSEAPSVAEAGESHPNEQPPAEGTPASTTAPASNTTQSDATNAESVPGPSTGTESNNNMFGDIELPDGVDPAFLAALPDNIRQEVIAEQLHLQRIQQRAQQQQQQAETLGFTEVNPDFLAALPPNIQEEVLAQQRAEQARLAQSSAPQGTAETSVDPSSFIHSLPPSLRQQVLADMDDSMVAVLPADLAAEANLLRRELEDRHRRMMEERLSQGAGLLSGILRHSGFYGRFGTTRYAIRPPPSRSGVGAHNWAWCGNRQTQGIPNANAVKMRGRHLLDHEALTCLLVLLFIDEPKLNTTRLHRVLRNLSYHGPTRAWIIRALLAILQKTGAECDASFTGQRKAMESITTGTPSCVVISEKYSRNDSSKKSGNPSCDPNLATSSKLDGRTTSQPTWLSISLDAALGCRANVFKIYRNTSSPISGGASNKKHGSSVVAASVHIHPQASPLVCRHVLDTLISLAKSFPNQFLPQNKAKEAQCANKEGTDDDSKALSEVSDTAAKPGGKPGGTHSQQVPSHSQGSSSSPDLDFWEILVRLDSSSSGVRKGKAFQRSHTSHGAATATVDCLPMTFEESPLGQLMTMLAHPVIRRSQQLTDRLLRLLGLVSISLPDLSQAVTAQPPAVTTPSAAPGISATPTTAVAAAPTVMVTTPAVVASVSTIPAATFAVTATSTPIAEAAAVTPATIPASTPSVTSTPAVPECSAEGATPVRRLQAQVEAGQQNTAAPTHEDESNTNKAIANDNAVLKAQLKLAVEVLTSTSCSEEGLEDATSLLLQLSRANSATREMVLSLLLEGAQQLGLVVCQHIRTLLEEIRSLNAVAGAVRDEEMAEDPAGMPQGRGLLHDRFSGGTVVVYSQTKPKTTAGRELQLPSMSLLTSKTSSQQFLLRILKVIIQLRGAARSAARVDKRLSSMSEVMGILAAAAGARALMDTDDRQGVQDENSQQPAHHGAVRQTPAAAESSRAVVSQPQTAGNDEGRADTATTSQASTSSSQLTQSQPAETTPLPTTSDTSRTEQPMDVDVPNPSTSKTDKEDELRLPRLSDQLELDELWDALGECLTELAKAADHHAVLVLQPAVEAFFIVHAGEKDDLKKSDGQRQRREDQLAHLNADITAPLSPAPSSSEQSVSSLARQDSITSTPGTLASSQLPHDVQKFLKFADTHRMVLNQILRQMTTPLADGPFSVLVDHTRVLDFDVKRRYFRQELERSDEGIRREDLAVHVSREHVFEDSFRELHRRSAEEWKHRFYIVFEGEEGQDAGGLLREWYIIISREIFNPMYALFKTSPGDRVTYTINPSSHCNSNHLSYFKFVGRIIAKAIYDNKLLECYFTRSFYKHILGVSVKYSDMESEDYAFYQGLAFLMEHSVEELGYDLTFSTEIQEFGVTEVRELKPNGCNIVVTEENKKEYLKLVCQMKMTGAIRKQLNAFLEGFYDIIPKRLISIFNEQELELLLSGLPNIDIDDLKANTEYHKYQPNSLQIQWFWRALRSFDQADRARFLQFVTGTSKVPLQGFAHLEGMNGTQKFQIHRDDRSTERLPSAHTCFNQLDLPAYETYDKLKNMLLIAINECSEGFGLA